MHKVADRVTDGLGIPLLHLADATAAAVTAAGIRRVGLLGTGFTMGRPFYRDRLAAHGLDVLVPAEADRDLVHRVIYDELVLGVVKPESKTAYRGVIARLVEAGAEGVIYGCTEIELLVGPDDSPVPTFPTTRLHADAAVDYALGKAPLPPAPSHTLTTARRCVRLVPADDLLRQPLPFRFRNRARGPEDVPRRRPPGLPATPSAPWRRAASG